ncbi:MAG TPA: class I adenylate-forming enzyme family protein [Thermoanaerobaculia bacterium]|nr:class I adenylate-forming enzyme family protein [Thermoanaerobaculia bacterium]
MTPRKSNRYSPRRTLLIMYETFVALAAASRDAAALIDGQSGEVIKRAALLGRSRDLAARFIEAGLRRGDLVGIQLPNSLDFVAAILAICQLDLVAVPIDRDATETEVAAVLGQFSVRGLIYRAGRNGDTDVSIRQAVDRPGVIPADARLIKLTSGSTGKPKGIVTSEANLRADCTNICRTMRITSGDLNLGAIPFSHSYGFSNLVMPLLLQGTAVVVSNDYLPQSILSLTNHHRCSVVPAIPMVFEHLTTLEPGNDFRSVRTFLSAGAPLPAAVSRRFRERFGIAIHVFYGCSESGGITYDRDGGAAERGGVGAAMEGVALQIDRRTARLSVRGEAVALGYLLDARTFQPFHEAFLTDDLAERDANGEVVLTGRAGDLINTAGKKVNPREVEHVLLQMEGIRQAKVYGEPAGARGEVVAAAIVASPDVTREQVRSFCRQHLSAHKVPRIVKLIESIPVDERGKVRRAALALL